MDQPEQNESDNPPPGVDEATGAYICPCCLTVLKDENIASYPDSDGHGEFRSYICFVCDWEYES